MARQSQPATTRASTATRAKAQRQPNRPPIQAASGMPATEATDQPRKTKVMALPRCASGTSRPTQAAAWGVKMAGGTTASTRSGISQL